MLDSIDLPVFGAHGEPMHEPSVVTAPGLYFVGRPLLFAMSSSLIGGVGRDADFIAEHIASRATARERTRGGMTRAPQPPAC